MTTRSHGEGCEALGQRENPKVTQMFNKVKGENIMRTRSNTYEILGYLSLVFVIAFGFITIVASGGGGGGNDGRQTDSAPVITDLSYYPESTIVGAGGGAISVTVYMNFFDDDGNVSTITLVVKDSEGYIIDNIPQPISDVAGETSGEIESIYSIPTSTTADDYTFQFYITDTTGLSSNVLEGNFSITLGSAPAISNGVSAPSWAYVDSGTILVEGTYDFTDIDGNAYQTDIYVYDSEDNLVIEEHFPISNISGLTYGQVEFGFDMPISVAGDYVIEIGMTDENGLFSYPPLYGSFSVYY